VVILYEEQFSHRGFPADQARFASIRVSRVENDASN
jgi:hypothetical protein